MTQVEQNFIEAFQVALCVDGEYHDFAFSDGCSPEGRIYARIQVLFIRDDTQYLHLHSHDYNSVVYHGGKKFVMRACDVPDGAHLYAGDYVDLDEVSYKITLARLKDQMWDIEMSILGTT
jgi:hypothetical protein